MKASCPPPPSPPPKKKERAPFASGALALNRAHLQVGGLLSDMGYLERARFVMEEGLRPDKRLRQL